MIELVTDISTEQASWRRIRPNGVEIIVRMPSEIATVERLFVELQKAANSVLNKS